MPGMIMLLSTRPREVILMFSNISIFREHIHTQDDEPLYQAINKGHLNIVKYFIDRGIHLTNPHVRKKIVGAFQSAIVDGTLEKNVTRIEDV